MSEVKLPVLAWLMPTELVGGSRSEEAALGIDGRTGSVAWCSFLMVFWRREW